MVLHSELLVLGHFDLGILLPKEIPMMSEEELVKWQLWRAKVLVLIFQSFPSGDERDEFLGNLAELVAEEFQDAEIRKAFGSDI